MCKWDRSPTGRFMKSQRRVALFMQSKAFCTGLLSGCKFGAQLPSFQQQCCMEAECTCHSSLCHPLQEKRKNISKQFLQSTTFLCMPSMVYFLLHRTDTNIKKIPRSCAEILAVILTYSLFLMFILQMKLFHSSSTASLCVTATESTANIFPSFSA